MTVINLWLGNSCNLLIQPRRMLKDAKMHILCSEQFISRTILFAGMTSEGGGAVAFPVMTLALGIKPAVARDFSLMIQSCGKHLSKSAKFQRFSSLYRDRFTRFKYFQSFT